MANALFLFVFCAAFLVSETDARSLRTKRQLPEAFKELFAPKSPIPGINASDYNALTPMLYGQTPVAPNPFRRPSPVNPGPPINTKDIPDIAWLNPDTVSAVARPQVPIGPTDPVELTRILQSEAQAKQAGYQNLTLPQKLDIAARQTGYSKEEILALLLQANSSGYNAQQISGIARQRGIILSEDEVKVLLDYAKANEADLQSGVQSAECRVDMSVAQSRLYDLADQSRIHPGNLLTVVQNAKDQHWTYDQVSGNARTQGINMSPDDAKLLYDLLDCYAGKQGELRCPAGGLSAAKMNEIAQQSGMTFQEASQQMIDASKAGVTHEQIAANGKTRGVNLEPVEVACVVGDRAGTAVKPAEKTIDQKLDDLARKTGISKEQIISLTRQLRASGQTPEQIAATAKKQGFGDITPDEVRQVLGEEPLNSPTTPRKLIVAPGSKLALISRDIGMSPEQYVAGLKRQQQNGKTPQDLAVAAQRQGYDVSPTDIVQFLNTPTAAARRRRDADLPMPVEPEDLKSNPFAGPTSNKVPLGGQAGNFLPRTPQTQGTIPVGSGQLINPVPAQPTLAPLATIAPPRPGRPLSDLSALSPNLPRYGLDGRLITIPPPQAMNPIDCNSCLRGPFSHPQAPNGVFINSCNQIIPVEQLIPILQPQPQPQIAPNQPQPQLQTVPSQPPPSNSNPSSSSLDENLEAISRRTGFSKQQLIDMVVGANKAGQTPEMIAAVARQQGIDTNAQEIQELIKRSQTTTPVPSLLENHFGAPVSNSGNQPETRKLTFGVTPPPPSNPFRTLQTKSS